MLLTIEQMQIVLAGRNPDSWNFINDNYTDAD